MTIEQEALDEAARKAGYEDWRVVKIAWHDGHLIRTLIQNHADEIVARKQAESDLAAFKREVSEAAKAVLNGLGEPKAYHEAHLAHFITPAADPLVALLNAAGAVEMDPSILSNEGLAKFMWDNAAKHGLKLERLDQ